MFLRHGRGLEWMTSALLLVFAITLALPGDTLAEAAKNFSDAAQKALEATAERLEKMRREAESSIIVPDKGGGPGGGFGGLEGV